MSDQFTKALLAKVMGLNRPVIALYPVVSGVPAGGATIAAQAGAWSAAYVDIIAAAGIVVDFWLLQFQYDLVGAATETFDVQIYNLTVTTTIYEDHLDTTAVETNIGPTTPPFPIYCPANAQIQTRVGAAAATAINVSALVATGI